MAGGFHPSESYGDGGRSGSRRFVLKGGWSRLLCHELYGEHRARTGSSLVFALVIKEDAKRRRQAQQFIMRQTELPAARMTVAEVVVKAEGFVQ